MLLLNAVKPLPQESAEHLLNALIANDDKKIHLINTQAESDPIHEQIQYESNIDRETDMKNREDYDHLEAADFIKVFDDISHFQIGLL